MSSFKNMNIGQMTFVLALLAVIQVYGQQVTYPIKGDHSIVQIKEFYKECGKIFSRQNFLIPQNAGPVIVPSTEEILLAELIMDSSFVELVKSTEALTRLQGLVYKVAYVDFYRQYAGFSDINNERIVAIHLIKCCKGKLKRCFPNWKLMLGNPLDEDPCTITSTYMVNLDNRKVLDY
jgi:hypothetical protein